MCEVMEKRTTQVMRKPVVESSKALTNMFVLNLRVAAGANNFLPIESHRQMESTVVSSLVQGLARTFPNPSLWMAIILFAGCVNKGFGYSRLMTLISELVP